MVRDTFWTENIYSIQALLFMFREGKKKGSYDRVDHQPLAQINCPVFSTYNIPTLHHCWPHFRIRRHVMAANTDELLRAWKDATQRAGLK